MCVVCNRIKREHNDEGSIKMGYLISSCLDKYKWKAVLHATLARQIDFSLHKETLVRLNIITT
jgi:hypothetical protein